MHKTRIFKMSEYHPYKVDQLVILPYLLDILREIEEMFLQTNWIRYNGYFSIGIGLCCLCKGLSRYLKDIFKDLPQHCIKKSCTCMNYGNDETQTPKPLIPSRKPNHFDHKRYQRKRILKFGFVLILNNRNCAAA